MSTYQKYRGFTLVELLVVITIIGVLASLAAGGAWYASIVVRNTMTKSQLSQMDMALEAYKNEFGEYPPMLNDRPAVVRHANSRWKRANLDYDAILTTAGLEPDKPGDTPGVIERKRNERIAASLTFWLGGRYDSTKESYVGFSADLEDPFKPGGQRTETRFDFSEKNTQPFNEADANVRYFAVDKKPVIYFRSTASGDYDPTLCVCGWVDRGDAVPYMKNATTWHGAKKYQLIHPGRDGHFGTGPGPRITADGTGIIYEDQDNIVNFTDTATLKGALNP